MVIPTRDATAIWEEKEVVGDDNTSSPDPPGAVSGDSSEPSFRFKRDH